MEKLKFLCLSLMRDTKKRNYIRRQLDATIHEYEFFNATDGNLTEARKYYSVLSKRISSLNKFLTPAEYGCADSHYRMIESIIENKDEVPIIVEDDVFIPPAVLPILAEVIKFARRTDGIFILGGQEGLPSARYISSSPTINSFSNKSDIFSLIKLNRLGKTHVKRTCSYYANRSTLEQLHTWKKANVFHLADEWNLLPDYLDVYFIDLLQHPYDLDSSSIQDNRNRWQNSNVSGLASTRFGSYIEKVLKALSYRLKNRIGIMKNGS
jgi:glycosyl transferase, family 25